ncbi:MAG: alpha/beta family hydrolase [Pseudomonadota bacterium]
MTELILSDGFAEREHVLLLAHGSGAPPTSAFMTAFTGALAGHSIGIARFAFTYMAGIMAGGPRRPPPSAERLVDEFASAVEATRKVARGGAVLAMGGKSLGGRVATLLAARPSRRAGDDQIAGCVCLGYPFHPQGQPAKLRIAHFSDVRCPLLIVQGTRDPFGTADEVAGYDLPDAIRTVWLEDGDHDFKPRVRSGFTSDQHIATAASETADFMRSLRGSR